MYDATRLYDSALCRAQEKSVNHVVATIKQQLAAARDNPKEPSRVFVISTYVIGKERILLAVRQL